MSATKKQLSRRAQDEELGRRYKCDPRTIRNYRKEGAPLDDPEAMAEWLAQRHSMPSGTAEALADYDSISDLGEAKVARLIIQCKRDAHKLAVEQRQVIPMAEAQTAIVKLCTAFETAWDLAIEQIPNWIGLPKAKAQEGMRRMKERTWGEFHANPDRIFKA